MKKLKKALSLTLVLALSLALAAPAFAAETSGPCGEDFGDDVTWSYNDGTLTIQGSGAIGRFNYGYYTESGVLEVISSPWLILGYCDEITRVEIEDGVTAIGGGAFEECYAMTSITIPASVTTIGGNAFRFCEGLTDVYYSGSETQWQQVSVDASKLSDGISEGNDPLFNATIHYGVEDSGDVTPAEPEQPAAPAEPEQPTTPSAPVPTSVVLSPQKLAVDGEAVECEKYNIDGSNYFKLRDLAQVLNGTGSQFGVGFDAETSTVTITTGEAYESTGTELAAGVDNSATTQPSAQSIQIDGTAHAELTVYNIGGSNFFQLRELGSLLGFEVGYDGETNTATVTSAQK